MTALRVDRRISACIVLVTLATGCGSASSTSGYGSAADVAQAAGCKSPKDVSARDREFFVTSAVTCTIGGTEVLVNWFKSSTAKDSYKEAADAVGSPALAYGDDWAVGCYKAQVGCTGFVKAMSAK